MNTTVTLTDGTVIHTTYTDDVHALLSHMSLRGQDRVGFDLVDTAGRDWAICVGDVARVEVAR